MTTDRGNKNSNEFFSEQLIAEIPTESALTIGYKAQELSAKVGFDFTGINTVFEKVREEYSELEEAFQKREEDFNHLTSELGDCFFALVNLCRHLGTDPETLFKENVRKYLNRCAFVEETLKREEKTWSDLPLEEIYKRWKDAKKAGL